MQTLKIPWWFGWPIAIGWAVMGWFAPAVMPQWGQVAFFALAALSVIWGLTGLVWHYRSLWGRRMPIAVLVIVLGLGGCLGCCVIVYIGVQQAIAALITPKTAEHLPSSTETPLVTRPSPRPSVQQKIANPTERAQTKPSVAYTGQPVPSKPLGDTYNVVNSGSGTAIGRVDSISLGKPLFEMNSEQMAHIASQLDVSKPITVQWVGTTPSAVASFKLADYLESKGFTVTRGGGIGMRVPELETSVQLEGDTIFVDVRK